MKPTDRINLTKDGRALLGATPLTGYAATISMATGVTSPEVLAKIEDTMRHEIFHSTLDWQTSEQLEEGARQAYGIVRLMNRRQSDGVLPEDWDTAGLLGVPVNAIPGLVKDLRKAA